MLFFVVVTCLGWTRQPLRLDYTPSQKKGHFPLRVLHNNRNENVDFKCPMTSNVSQGILRMELWVSFKIDYGKRWRVAIIVACQTSNGTYACWCLIPHVCGLKWGIKCRPKCPKHMPKITYKHISTWLMWKVIHLTLSQWFAFTNIRHRVDSGPRQILFEYFSNNTNLKIIMLSSLDCIRLLFSTSLKV